MDLCEHTSFWFLLCLLDRVDFNQLAPSIPLKLLERMDQSKAVGWPSNVLAVVTHGENLDLIRSPLINRK